MACMAAQRNAGSDEEERERERRLRPVDGRVTVYDADDVVHLRPLLPKKPFQAELTYLVLNTVSLTHIPPEVCALPNLTRLGMSREIEIFSERLFSCQTARRILLRRFHMKLAPSCH